MRPLWGALGLAYLLLLPVRASGCSCARPFPPPRAALQTSAAVFTGRVLWISPKAQDQEVWFWVTGSWKGASSGIVRVSTSYDSAACGYHFVAGQNYLVYAYATSGRLYTNICTRTTGVSRAGADLAALGPATLPVLPWFVLTVMFALGLGAALLLCRSAGKRRGGQPAVATDTSRR
jgi:hypothetical protein